MPLYRNSKADAAIRTVEFSPLPKGNFTFFNLRSPADVDNMRGWLKSINQEILAETMVGKHPVLVTQGPRSQKALLAQVNAQQGDFTLSYRKKKIDIWAVRGSMGTAGQLLQVASSFANVNGLDIATLIFAVSNLIANGTNIAFGSEKQEDIHQQRFVKQRINALVAPQLAATEQLPDADDNRTALRAEPRPPQGMGQKFHSFMKHHSVAVGEIGLRYFGSFALAFPLSKKVNKEYTLYRDAPAMSGKKMAEVVEHTGSKMHFSFDGWKKGLKELGTLNFKQAFHVAKNVENANSLRGGLIYLTGKSIALTSTIPDPYDPKPHTALDTIRETVTFRLSSTIEACAGAIIAYDRFKYRKINVPDWKVIPKTFFGQALRGTKTCDFLGGIGGTLFASAYIIRFFAPFGEKQLNVEEIKAHATDALSGMPPEKLPQMIADCAATIKDHTKGKPIEFGQIYAQMASDLYRYHHVSLPNMPALANSHENQPFPELRRHAQADAAPLTTITAGPRQHEAKLVATPTLELAQRQG